MKVIVAGSRNIQAPYHVAQAIYSSPFSVSEIVSGGARGVDTLGEHWAYEHARPVTKFVPDWDKFGKGAGFRRNDQMAEYADALIAVWDGKSKGTEHMIKTMEALGKPVHVHRVDAT